MNNIPNITCNPGFFVLSAKYPTAPRAINQLSQVNQIGVIVFHLSGLNKKFFFNISKTVFTFLVPILNKTTLMFSH